MNNSKAMEKQKYYKFDAVIVGGGIAGLFTLAKLRNNGIHAILLEKNKIGGAQTILSQGIIHGGIKYALLGNITKAQKSIAKMPEYWNTCLRGDGDIDLSFVNVLTKNQLMWGRGLSEKVTAFFASRMMQSHVNTLNKKDLPEVLKNDMCSGNFYALNEPVIDVESLLKGFSKNFSQFILTSIDIKEVKTKEKKGSGHKITIEKGNDTILIDTESIIITAGEGSPKILPNKYKIKSQIRPLHMVKVKVPNDYENIFCHILGKGDKPKLTITSVKKNNDVFWYLGGMLAENGVHKTKEEQILITKDLLISLFPWLSFKELSFDNYQTIKVNRAEPLFFGTRPDVPFIKSLEKEAFGIYIAWPIKLAMAPILSDELLELFKKRHNARSYNNFDREKPFRDIKKEISYARF